MQSTCLILRNDGTVLVNCTEEREDVSPVILCLVRDLSDTPSDVGYNTCTKHTTISNSHLLQAHQSIDLSPPIPCTNGGALEQCLVLVLANVTVFVVAIARLPTRWLATCKPHLHT